MTLRVTLGEPLWREAGFREREVAVPQGEGIRLRELPAVLGITEWSEAGLLVAVNDRLVPVAELDDLILCDGDRVVLQILLAGG
jgi:sulfur carrier protein ThiS